MAEASLDAVVKDVSECKGEAATAQSVPSSGTPVAISPHALIAKGEAPIKRQFLKSIDRNSGVNNDKPADNARPSGARLSKNAAKRQKYEQRHQSRLTELCSAVSKGGSVACCSFGDRCRFNHDIQAYLKQKPEDLPGVCPFTHSPPGQEGSLRSQGGSQGGAVQAQSSSHANGGAAPATTAPEQADGGDVPPGNPGPQEGTAAQGKASPVDDVSKAGGGVAGAGVAGSLPITGAPVAGAVCPHNLSCRYMGTHPPQPEGSRVAARADEEGGEGRSLGASREFRDQDGEANFLRKEVKDTLWKGRASFPRADPLLIAAGVKLCGGYPDAVARAAEIVEKECAVDFVDVNMGCPIDLICNKGAGSALLLKSQRIENIVRITSRVLTCPLTVKLRTGYYDRENTAHKLLPHMREWGAAAVTLHGRSRQQRYSRAADWEYIGSCASACPSLPIIGNGDVYAFTDYYEHMERSPLATCMIARGALYKPWIFTEIKERRHWDISSGERMELLKKFVWFGLQHWGCDSRGVENTRRFLLEWLSYLHRYIPVGLLEVIPQRMHWRAPAFYGRDELETLFASGSPSDWIKISEMLLGRAPPGFTFTPKHSSDAYDNKGEMQNG
eukprot:jgi/Mesvir1/5157/Mv15298-RA.2